MSTATHTHKRSRPKHCGSGGSPNIPGRAPLGESKLDHYAIIKFPLTTKSARKKTEDNTLVFTVDVPANKHHMKQDVKKLYDTDISVNTKVNTLVRPNGEEKACA